MIAFLLAATVAASVPCTTPRPGADWVCVDGGWLPPGHPEIPAPPVPPAPPVAPGALVPEFKVGRTYKRDASGALLYITGIGTTRNGVAVVAAECLIEAFPDFCYFPGQGRFILANASTSGWTEQ